MRIPLAALLFSSLLITAAQARGSTMAIIPMFAQQIVLQQPAGWEVAYLYEDHSTSLAKFVPTEQTLFDWREMLSVEAYKEIATLSAQGPETMLRVIQNEYAGHCAADLSAQALDPLFINGYPNATMLLSCIKLADDFDGGTANEGIQALVVAIRGREDFYVVRYTVRSPQPAPLPPSLSAQNYRAYLELISPLLLCETGDDINACSDRRPAFPAASPKTSR